MAVQIDQGAAIALAIGDIFWLSVGAGTLAFLAVLTLPDLVLREQPTVTTEFTSTMPGCDKSIQGEHDLKRAAG